jgi:hypothetical protein
MTNELKLVETGLEANSIEQEVAAANLDEGDAVEIVTVIKTCAYDPMTRL